MHAKCHSLLDGLEERAQDETLGNAIEQLQEEAYISLKA